MKYLLFITPEGPRVEIFCAPTTHAEQAKAHAGWKLLSAGFVEFLGGGHVRCYGRSDSLNLGPGSRDNLVIQSMMRATLMISSPQPVPV
jgi:hypothetical protein